ncbi:phosphomannomutase/phosphoglucomutase, partial [Methylorubrum thiocyanatum]
MSSDRFSKASPMTFPTPRPKLEPNTFAFEQLPMVKPTGFREYDARWLFPQEINLMG